MWSYREPRTRQAGALLVVGVLLGAIGHAIFGPNQGPFEPSLQAALVATLGVASTGVLAYFAARIGAAASVEAAARTAASASEAADKDRVAAQLADLRARKVPMFERILDLAFTHERELRSQLAWWEDNAGGRYPGRPPVLNPTDELGDLAHQLFAFARQDTADLAQLLHDRLVTADENHAFDAARHVSAAGVVDELAAGAPEAFEKAMEDVDGLRTELIRAIRSELGLRGLVDKPYGTRLPKADRELD